MGTAGSPVAAKLVSHVGPVNVMRDDPAARSLGITSHSRRASVAFVSRSPAPQWSRIDDLLKS